MLFKKMTSLELSVTDENGIDGTVIAYIDDERMTEFDVIEQVCEDVQFSPSWSDVERAVESDLRKRTTWEG